MTIIDSSWLKFLFNPLYLVSAHSRKLVHAGVDEETFEARNSETDHLFQVRSIAWDHPAPEFDIDATLALCSLNFDPWDPFSDETPHDTAAYLRFSGDVVGGRAFRGMSTIVVTPPKAAALVAVVNPK